MGSADVMIPGRSWKAVLPGLGWTLLVLNGGVLWLTSRRRRRAVQVAQGQVAALVRTASALTVDARLDTVLGHVLTGIAEQLGARWALLFFHEGEQDCLAAHLVYTDGRVVPAAEAVPALAAPVPAQVVPLWADIVRLRRPLVVDDIAHNPRLLNRAALLADGVQSLLLVPLLLGEAVIGWFSVRSTERRPYRPEELELAQALAHQATLAVQLTRLAEQARQAAVAEERTRMAHEIHDTLAQGLTGILLHLEGIESALASGNSTAAHERLDRARQAARQSLAEARRSVWALRPQVLEEKPFPAAVRDSAAALTAGTGLAVDVITDGDCPPLPSELAADLLRVAQEAVTNVVKHAHATALAIRLDCTASAVAVQVRDNGRGFQPAAAGAADGAGFGLTAMRERVARHGGSLRLESRPGQGTTVIAEVPRPARSG